MAALTYDGCREDSCFTLLTDYVEIRLITETIAWDSGYVLCQVEGPGLRMCVIIL